MAYSRTRTPSRVRVGDFLPDLGGSVVTHPVKDPETKTVWVTIREGETMRDVELTGPIRTIRQGRAPKHVLEAQVLYHAARQAWEKARESETSNYRYEMKEFAETCPPPVFKTFLLEVTGRARNATPA